LKILSYHVSTQALFIAAVDALCALASLFAAVLFVNGIEDGVARFASWPYEFSVVVYTLLVVIGMAAMGLYDSRQRYGIEGALVRMLLGVCFAAVGMAFFGFLLALIEARLVWALTFAGSIVLMGLARVFFDRFREDEVFRRRVLVFGAGRRAARILELRRRSDQRGFRIVGFVPAPGDTSRINDSRVLSDTPGSLLKFAEENDVSEIVVAMDDRRKGFPLEDLLACKLSGLRVIDLLEFLERESGRVKVDIMNPSWLIFSESVTRRNRGRLSFKLLDLLIGGSVLILASPVMLVVALLILLEDGRPVLYRQERVGLSGRVFTIFKFRSMKKNAEATGQAVWAEVDDPRVTRVGRWLRKLRLDELPQLFNVIKGQMSIVGPRPERPQFVEALAQNMPYYHERHYVKPGITGWAQLCYPYGSSEQDALAKLEFDLYYVKNRSVVFYLMILLQTAEVILWQKGSR
jgi:sugar transferase (PEP-CTERM system associated)